MEIVKAHTRASDLKIPDIVPQPVTPVVGHAIVDGARFDWDNINGDGVAGSEGVLFQKLGINSVKFLKGRPSPNFGNAPIAPLYSVGPGEKKAIRVNLSGGSAANAAYQLLVVETGAGLFYSNNNDIAGWQWIQFDYAANGVLKWYVNGALEYNASPAGAKRVTFECKSVAAGLTFTLDCGLDGGSPPAGYAWM